MLKSIITYNLFDILHYGHLKKTKEYGLEYEHFIKIGRFNPLTACNSKYYGKDIDKISVHHPFDLKGKVENGSIYLIISLMNL